MHIRYHSGYVISQRETALQCNVFFHCWTYTQNDPSCNVVSHVLRPYQEWSLHIYRVERLRSLFMNVVGGCYQSCRLGNTYCGLWAASCHEQFIYWWGLSGQCTSRVKNAKHASDTGRSMLCTCSHKCLGVGRRHRRPKCYQNYRLVYLLKMRQSFSNNSTSHEKDL